MADTADRSVDLDQRRIGFALALIFTAVAIAVAVAAGLIALLGGTALPAKHAPPTARPRLEAHPAPDLARYRATQQEILSHYSWVDRRQGIVRIPISRAMDIVATRGRADSERAAQDSKQ